MITINLDLPDGLARELAARLRENAHQSIDDYVRDLIQSDLESEDAWEMTPKLAAALAEGEASGTDPRTINEIIEDGRARSSV